MSHFTEEQREAALAEVVRKVDLLLTNGYAKTEVVKAHSHVAIGLQLELTEAVWLIRKYEEQRASRATFYPDFHAVTEFLERNTQ